MKPRDLENELQRLPMREVPGAWRGEILRAARAAGAAEDVGEPGWLLAAGLKVWRELILPNRLAWAGVALAWLIILSVDVAQVDYSKPALGLPARPAPQMIQALEEQRRLLAELLPPAPRHLAPARKPESRPRSDCSLETFYT